MTIDEQTTKGAIEVVQQVGFPIVVALYYLFKTDRTIERNTEALNLLRESINKALDK